MSTNTINREAMKSMNIDDILEMSVQDIADLAERITWPTGEYQYAVTVGEVDAGTETSGAFLKVAIELVAITELEDPEAEAPEVGTIMEMRFYQGYGIEKFKTTFGERSDQLEDELGAAPTIGQLLEGIVGTSWSGLIEAKSRKDKEDETKRIEFNEVHPHLQALTN